VERFHCFLASQRDVKAPAEKDANYTQWFRVCEGFMNRRPGRRSVSVAERLKGDGARGLRNREESIFHFPLDIRHLPSEKSTQAMTNDKRNMGNGKCSPFKVSSLTN
jgi:hypothetical protein